MKKTKKYWAFIGGSVALAVAGLCASYSFNSHPVEKVDASTTVWNRVTSISAGDVVTLASEAATKDSAGTACTGVYLTGFNGGFSTTATSNYGKGTKGTFSSGSFSASDALELTVVAGSATSSYSFKCASGGTDYYLSAISGNYLNLTTSVSNASSWTLTANSTNAKLNSVSQTTRNIGWNNSSPRFACYTTTQTSVQLYKKGTSISVTAITGADRQSLRPYCKMRHSFLKTSL